MFGNLLTGIAIASLTLLVVAEIALEEFIDRKKPKEGAKLSEKGDA